MDMLAGKKLVMKNCQTYKAALYLRNVKIIIYYFSASWVDDLDLLDKLKIIHAENKKRNLAMEVIYVSADSDEKQFSKYFRDHHGPWPSISINNTVLSEELRYRYNITCLPQMVVVRKEDSFVITRRGREELEKTGINVLVAWSDYEPDLILTDDNFEDNLVETKPKAGHYDLSSRIEASLNRTHSKPSDTADCRASIFLLPDL
ncbi:hypothetical protein NQ315_009101 [Exocentrus adspersus]|uniref:Thioredoxin-like fold domain-containing protein n=1 Tax=Exocentrus adspersus TaxID=1586481 RepID=A0AAV8WFS1_9CUCU|nr:hypothetical protein NQ315_009101 [Exocentrus adspersus]